MPVNIRQTLEDLRKELARVEAAIASMEDMQRDGAGSAKRSKRGRKSMGADERVAVSVRMKKYWANRRSEKPGTSTE
jgi:hypothetical protein